VAAEIRSLTLTDAVAAHERIAIAQRPATLHPAYVAADAARDASLTPTYLIFEDQGHVWMHGLHLTAVPGGGLKDASSPYGYGGPVATTDDPAFIAAAWAAYAQWMREQRVAVEYVRFHPVLGNDQLYGGQVADNRQVVSMELAAAEPGAAYPSRLRQTLKKAAAAGLVYEEGGLKGHAAAFGAFHRAAMGEMRADSFYLFSDAYFDRLAESAFATLGICRHPSSAQWLAACLFLDGPGVREYHLAATNEAGRKWGASSFALHQAAVAGRRMGLRQMYLGGGTNASADNPLFFFKSSFSAERLTYRTGWTVFDSAAYDEMKQRFPAEWAAHPERPIFYRKV
jgi:hypothetical protein